MGCHVDCSGQLLRHGQCSQGDRPLVRTQGQNVRPRAAKFGDDVAKRIRLDAHRLAGERLFVPPVEFELVDRDQPGVANLDRHLGGGLPQFGEAAVPAWPSRPTPWTTGSRRRRKAANGSRDRGDDHGGGNRGRDSRRTDMGNLGLVRLYALFRRAFVWTLCDRKPRPFGRTQSQIGGEGIQRKPQCLSALDEANPTDKLWRKLPIAGRRTGRLRQQPPPLVIPHGFQIHPRASGEFTNRQCFRFELRLRPAPSLDTLYLDTGSRAVSRMGFQKQVVTTSATAADGVQSRARICSSVSPPV
jgi:hypothetical protein